MNTISFMTANYVAREIGYNMTKGWMEGDDATNAFFAPIDTYAERFDALVAEVRRPFGDALGREGFALPAPAGFRRAARYRRFRWPP